jgi:hypothetical protein
MPTLCRALLLLMLTAPALGAQPRAPSDGLSRRMRAFVDALQEYPRDTLVTFLPRRGAWTWVLTTHFLQEDRVGLWRLGADDLLPGIDHTGPLCESFSRGGDAITMGTLFSHLIFNPGRWRRVPGNRFVPPGASARSPVFVEWRREDGRWVLSAFGDERYVGPRLLGREVNAVVRDTGPRTPPPAEEPADARYAAGTHWYEERLPLVVDGEHLVMYGLPHSLAPGDLLRLGTVHGVPVYVEAGSTGTPAVIYVPLSHGVYQPYQDTIGNGCA